MIPKHFENRIWLFQKKAIPLHPMSSHKNGWWLVIGCSLNAIHSRTRRLERLLIRNPQNPQSPKLPLYKEILQILTKLRKNERNAK